MKGFLVLVFLKLIANIETTKPKSVNLALKTVLEFDQKSNVADVKFLDNMQEFLDKVRNVLRNKTARRFDTENKNIKFTDFIKSLIDILKRYDDDDLEDVFAVFDNEIRKNHYRGCKFYELVEDQNVRRFVANKLEDIKDKPADKLRQSLDNAKEVLEDAKFSGPRTEFLDYVNSLYRQDSVNKLREFLNNLETYNSKSKRANLNLIKIVQDGLRSVIFDHYSRLNANARRYLKIKLETSWRDPKYLDRVERKIWTVQYTNSFDSMKYKNKNYQTKDTKQLTKPIATHKHTNYDSESNDSDEVTTRNLNKDSKDSETKEVYFNKDKYNKLIDNDNDFETVTTKSITHDLASESDSDEIPTTRKLKPRKHKDKRHKQTKKLSTFITLYPKIITVNNKRFKIESTTRKARLSTLWEEELKHKNVKKRREEKLKRSKSKIDLRTGVDKPRVIADSETIIDVKRAVSSKDSIEQINKGIRETTKKQTWQQTRTTEEQYKPTTLKKSRKNLPERMSLEDKSGISIDSFETKRRSLLDKNNSEQNDMKLNVLRRINQLEKQMEEVKIKIDSKLTTVSKNNKFSLLDHWIGTTVATDTVTTNASTNTTTKQSITKQSTNVTTLETTTIKTDSNKSIEMTAEKENKTQINNTTESVQDRNTTIESIKDNENSTISEQNEHLDLPDEVNDVGIDNDIDNIIKKYNINITTYKPNFDKYLETKPEKDSKVKELIASDLKKVFGDGRKGENVPIDAYHDLNAVLDLGEAVE